MAKLLERIKGTVRAEICGIFPEAVLNACALGAIVFWDLESVDAYTLRLTVYEKELEKLRTAAAGAMCELKILDRRGGSRDRRLLRRRKWLLLSGALAAALLALSSLFIWEIDVRGCDKLSQGRVLRALEDCGVGLGTWWPGLSADLVRSRMLTELPELAWMTVNVSGSRAVVLLSERLEKPEIIQEDRPADILAGKTGIINRVSVLSGKPLAAKGQAVVRGETLVSGTVDSLTRPARQVRAQAEVLADTWYELTAVSPAKEELKTGEGRVSDRFALRLGKKRINFYLESGKRLDERDKIVYEYTLGIKGLFALPVTLIREEQVWPETAPAADSGRAEEMQRRLYASLRESIDGEIVSSGFSVSRSGELLQVTLRARCRENIAVCRELAAP